MPELRLSREIYQFENFAVRPEDGTLVRNGYDVPLQDQPFRLLVLLVSRAGSVVTRDELQGHLWPANTNVEFDKSLRVAVSKLREALRDSASQPLYIETIPRRGYRFIMPVTVVAPSPRAAMVPAVADDVPEVVSPGESPVALTSPDVANRLADLGPSRPPSRPLRHITLWLAIAATVLAAFLTVGIKRPGHDVAPSVAAHVVDRRSVAVIGLRNLSGSPGDQWLSTGLAEMLSTELSASGRMRVISGEEVARAGLSEPPASTPSHASVVRYANQLGADIVIFGSYTLVHKEAGTASSQMRLDLRVDDVSSDTQSISLVRTGRTNDLFSLVSSTGSELRQHFGLGEMSLNTASAVRRTLPANPEAAKLYAEGLSHLRAYDPPGGRDLLLKAEKIEPGHAGTHLALADAWHSMGYEGEAKAQAARAVDLGAGLPREELLTMQGELAVLSSDWPRAIDIYHSLIVLYPDDIEIGLRLVAAQNGANQFVDAMTTLKGLRRAGLLRADEARLDLGEAKANEATGNFRPSIVLADKAIAIATELDNKLLHAQALATKAASLERLGDSEHSLAASLEEENLFRAVNDKRGLATALLTSGDVLYDKGETAEARSRFLLALDSFREVRHPYDMGVTMERIGNTYYEEGLLLDSRKYYQQALHIYRELHDDGSIGSAIGNIANVQDMEGDIPGALEGNAGCLALGEKTGDKRLVASTLANMGVLEMERGSLDRAAADFSHAAEIDRQMAYGRGLSHALVGQGDVLLERGDIGGALRQYDLGAKAIESIDEPEVRVPALVGQGSGNFLSGKADRASAYLTQAADTAVHNKEHALATVALMWLSRSLLAQGRIAQAFDAASHAVAESQAQSGPQVRSVAMLALARVMIAQGRIAPAQEEIRAALVIAERHGYLPLEMDLRILLAETATDVNQRRLQLSALAKTAEVHGWSRIASDARKQHL